MSYHKYKCATAMVKEGKNFCIKGNIYMIQGLRDIRRGVEDLQKRNKARYCS